jgi:hypothetical protein
MKSLRLVSSLFLALVPALQAAPLELERVQQQYETAVTAPYTTAKAELDTKFIAALGKAASTAMEAGQLDEVLAIQADQKLLTEKLSIPDDDTQATESLKNCAAFTGPSSPGWKRNAPRTSLLSCLVTRAD